MPSDPWTRVRCPGALWVHCERDPLNLLGWRSEGRVDLWLPCKRLWHNWVTSAPLPSALLRRVCAAPQCIREDAEVRR